MSKRSLTRAVDAKPRVLSAEVRQVGKQEVPATSIVPLMGSVRMKDPHLATENKLSSQGTP